MIPELKKRTLGNRTRITPIRQGGNADYHRSKNNKIRVNQRLALAIRVFSVPIKPGAFLN